MPFIELPGGRIHYRLEGPRDAPALVLSNSLGTDLSMWEPQVPAFSRQFRVLRYDTRGHGASEFSATTETIAGHGRDVVEMLSYLGIERAHFCGLSMGGMIGMWLAARAPEYVDKLVLCNTSARIGTSEMWDARIVAIKAGGMEAVAPAVMARFFSPSFLDEESALVQATRRVLIATLVEGYGACCAAIRDGDQSANLCFIQAPTLVLAGTHDLATPPGDGQSLARAIQGARYCELNAAHLSNIEAPEQFTEALLRFLAE
ncbi:MAG TPA: 3-oxoadipate enol-lactonase [Chloroflexota bacterium]|nr:3-oxoadipate enol-lactonase [Chloroflexota bacterium]